MTTKRIIIGMMSLVGVMTLAGCTQVDEAVVEAAARETGVPIVFECGDGTDSAGETHGTRATSGATGFISSENGHLKYTGFGIFAREEEDVASFNFMSNQKVEYTFLANYPIDLSDGYWSYQPLKYWPYKYDATEQKNVPKTLTFCAYAPYVDRESLESLPEGTTGITGMSATGASTPTLTYVRGKTLEESVNLLWGYHEANDAKAVQMKMLHALARVSVSVTLKSAPGIDKVLVEQVTLSGTIATKGTLNLTSHDEVTIDEETFRRPNWTVNESETTSIVIDSNPAQYHQEHPTKYSYGTISEGIHYALNAINGVSLPKDRQPDGLKLNDTQNVLVQDDDQKTYLLLIPQASLSLSANIVLQVYTTGSETPERREKLLQETVIGEPFYGNRAYKLNLQVEL